MSGVRVSLIAAVASNGVIGRSGGMPWRLSTDMKRFRRLTMGKPVVVGRKTFEGFGKPLEGRVNIVVSRGLGPVPAGVLVAPDIASALALAVDKARASGADEVMVIGGGQIYAGTIGGADRLYITHVEAAPEGDTRFPEIDPGRWRVVTTEHVPAGERDSAPTRFVVYERAAS